MLLVHLLHLVPLTASLHNYQLLLEQLCILLVAHLALQKRDNQLVGISLEVEEAVVLEP
jgi:hypothetical protein